MTYVCLDFDCKVCQSKIVDRTLIHHIFWFSWFWSNNLTYWENGSWILLLLIYRSLLPVFQCLINLLSWVIRNICSEVQLSWLLYHYRYTTKLQKIQLVSPDIEAVSTFLRGHTLASILLKNNSSFIFDNPSKNKFKNYD